MKTLLDSASTAVFEDRKDNLFMFYSVIFR